MEVVKSSFQEEKMSLCLCGQSAYYHRFSSLSPDWASPHLFHLTIPTRVNVVHKTDHRINNPEDKETCLCFIVNSTGAARYPYFLYPNLLCFPFINTMSWHCQNNELLLLASVEIGI